MLGGRYRIIAPIGRGASAQVFLADDVRLRRRVALKVLHAALADDAEFLRRFQAEARAAAALNHPNVMAVYDWGQDGADDIPYLVLEYLGGGSLRDMLDRDQRLSPSQALRIGLEATRALEYAHRRGLVHRDVKPANLLFGDEARLRIADFGLARALAEAAWTEPQGAVLGTARYSSPEQAQGQALTGKADVYSLALTLVEAVTGVVPFAADTTIGTLMARVGRPLEVPDELGPLQGPLERAGRANPEDRIDSHELAIALMAAADAMPKPEPLPLAGAVAAGTGGDDRYPTLLPTTAVIDLTDADTAVTASVGPRPGDDGRAGADGEPSPPPVEPATRRGRRWPWVLVALVLLAALAAAVAAVVERPDRTPAHAVPGRVVGLQEDDAREALAPFKWDVREEHTRRDGTIAGEVIAVRPRPGLELEEGSRVTLVISDGNTPTTVPADLRGRSFAEASLLVAARGLVAEVGSRAFDEEIAKDAVIRLGDGTPTTMIKGGTVFLVVSDGPAPREVPAALVGATVEAAEAELGRVQLVAGISYRNSDTVAEGLVIGSDQEAGTKLPRGSTVHLVVSDGPAPQEVPAALVGATVEAAEAELGQVQLVAGISYRNSDTVAEGLVISSDQEAGTKLPSGSTVRLVVSLGPELVAVPDIRGSRTLAEAAARLEAAGFVAGEVQGPLNGLPAATDPVAGTMVGKGTVVNVTLAG